MTSHPLDRRSLLALAAGATMPALASAATPVAVPPNEILPEARRFDPQPGPWRTFELVTRVTLRQTQGASRVWVPLPSVEADYQQLAGDAWSGNAAAARVSTDGRYGARMLVAEFDASQPAPVIEVASRVRVRSRAADWSRKAPGRDAADSLRAWTQPTSLIPTDGIVRRTALEASRGAGSDREKVQRLYDWVVQHTHREPKVRGCGVGDIRTMLETGDLSGKCGDINGLFVGLVRAVGIPARDVYGIRLAPSAFGYRELGGNPANLKGAQHCRAEVWLKDHGWVAMDPADVGKVMRLESPQWIKDPSHPLVAPVNKALFGGWEGNWLAYNTAHDVVLPGSSGPALGFLMYPQAEDAGGRFDPLEPDAFRYAITAREVRA